MQTVTEIVILCMRTEGCNFSEIFLKSVLVNYKGQGDGTEE